MTCLGRVSKPLCILRTQCFSDGIEQRATVALVGCLRGSAWVDGANSFATSLALYQKWKRTS